MAQLEIRNLKFKYPNNNKLILNNLSLVLKRGEFVVLTGSTGSGKTTLLKMIKKELAPFGETSGEILYDDKNLQEKTNKELLKEIGYVFQNPNSQIITEYVWSELAFGLENLGISTTQIQRRVGEIAQFFGINNWFDKKTINLSGGEKQKLSLAAIIAMEPSLLLLDEPTAQLDPLAREEFFMILKKINEELGITILLVEQNLEEVFSFASRVLVLKNGKIVVDDHPKAAINSFPEELIDALPTPALFYRKTNGIGEVPLTVREGRDYLFNTFKNEKKKLDLPLIQDKETIISLKDLWFRYTKQGKDILSGLYLDIKKGEILSVLGGNGSGKTTLLKVIAQIYKPYRGKIKNKSNKTKIAMLPQDPEDLFLGPTILDDLRVLENRVDNYFLKAEIWIEKLAAYSLLNRNFYDLSGGEKQKVGLLKVLLTTDDIILLDEPSKGLDSQQKNDLIKILKEIKDSGISIIIVSHDIEFTALVSDRCALLFSGLIWFHQIRYFITAILWYNVIRN